MNEALKPDIAERATPATVAPPRQRRSLWGRIAIVAALAAVAAFAYFKYEKRGAPTKEPQVSGRAGQGPQTVRVAPVASGDMPITIDALGTVTPFER